MPALHPRAITAKGAFSALHSFNLRSAFVFKGGIAPNLIMELEIYKSLPFMTCGQAGDAMHPYQVMGFKTKP